MPGANFVSSFNKVLESRSEAEDAVSDALLSILGTFHHEVTKSKADYYLVGNGGDFREFSVPIAESFGAKLAGVACLWTYRMHYANRDNSYSYSIPSECVESPGQKRHKLVICQTVISSTNELVAMISRIVPKLMPIEIMVVCAIANSNVLEQLEAYTISRYGLKPRVVAAESSRASLVATQANLFELLDDRPLKIAPLMSRWLANRHMKPRPEQVLESDGPTF